MTLTNVTKKQNPRKCEGFAVVVTETNKLQLYFYGTTQKCATIKANASAIVVSVGTTSIKPHIIGAPVYIIHCESNVSEHGSGSGHPTEVGHGAGLGMKLSSHPHFLHVFFVVAIFYKLINMELELVLKDHMDLYKS
jgi:hypothetical protein